MAVMLPVPDFDCVVFGATGDLTLRKLLPALYHRFLDKQVTGASRIIAAARSDLTDATFRERAEAGLREHVAKADLKDDTLAAFLQIIFYVRLDGAGSMGWSELRKVLAHAPKQDERVRVFYLATSPGLYGAVSQNLAQHKLITDNSRVVLEKPIGHDLDSARQINNDVGAVFRENQIFRIDHYLGKETVQNLLALRFANVIFERLWTADVIDHVQITVAETVGVEQRAEYYDHSGALRDMVQNHLLQLLCLLAMEPPIALTAEALRDEKLKVLRALKPIAPHAVPHVTVRGQYAAGAVAGKSVDSYQKDLDSQRDGNTDPSTTETFVAVKAEINSWRWAGVPFYLRSGKRLPQKVSEIVVQFRNVPFSVFPRDAAELEPNRLIIRLQPHEGIKLGMMSKDPGPGGLRLRPSELDISFEEAFAIRYHDAYERLLMDTVRGNATLFMRRDEVEAAWTWVEPILDAWAEAGDKPRPYAAGSWGPTASIALIERDGRTWHEDIAS
jgi:glucose-6-phosphate 1-dehydrogenase